MVALCVCKKTSNPPYCDGSHKTLHAPDPEEAEAAELDAAMGDIATEVEDALDRHEADGTMDELDTTIHDAEDK